jgi:HlyD family secretion protein
MTPKRRLISLTELLARRRAAAGQPVFIRGQAWTSICVLGIVTALTVVGPACSPADRQQPGPTVTVQVAPAERTRIEQQVVADAVLYPLHQAALVPKISAPVSKFYVNRGSHVRVGELVAELENKDLAAALAESRGLYEQAQATYETTVKASVPEEIQKASLDLKAAKATLDAQQKVVDSRQMLYRQGAIPRKDLDDATLNLTQARNQYDIAQRRLQSLERVGKELELKAAEGELAAAKGKYQGAQAQLSYSQIRSPLDGVVTDRPLYPGEMASSGSPLITVMDLSRVVARAHIAQQQAALLRVDAAATLSVPGASEAVPGEVTLVSPALDPNSTTVEVWVEAANPGERLKPGTSVRVTIVAKTVPDAVVIPSAALLMSSDGATSVMVAGPDNEPQQKAVKVGVRQGDEVQITEGLRVGERVVTLGAYELSQEDPDALAKTKLEIQTESSFPRKRESGESSDKGSDKD